MHPLFWVVPNWVVGAANSPITNMGGDDKLSRS